MQIPFLNGGIGEQKFRKLDFPFLSDLEKAVQCFLEYEIDFFRRKIKHQLILKIYLAFQ